MGSRKAARRDCRYIYDAWGNHLSITGSLSGTLGYYNPLRYRGYVYDPEFELYYLQSRYYNAGLGRFNAPDSFVSTGQGILGNNMYAYCRNNPVIRKDASGTEDVCVENFNEDNTPINDVGNPSGSGGGTRSSTKISVNESNIPGKQSITTTTNQLQECADSANANCYRC